MKFREVYLFELRYQLSRPAIWIFFAVVMGFSCLATVSLIENVQEGDYFLNSPVIISLITGLSSMFGLLLSAALCGNAAVRDRQTGMDSLLYTTSLKKADYLGGRFLAMLSINILVLLLLMAFLFLSSLIPSFQEFFTSNYFSSYAHAFLYFAIPNTLISSAILFSVSLLTRKAMAAFLAAALLFFVALFSMDILAAELGKWDLAKKLDLSGLTFLKELRALQTPLELKSAFVEPENSFYLIRLLWMGGSLLLLAWTLLKFQFHIKTGRKKSSRKLIVAPPAKGDRIWSNRISVPTTSRTFDLKTKTKQVLYLSFSAFRSMFKGMVWLIYPAIAMITIIASEEVMEGQLGVPLIPANWMVLDFLRAMGSGLILALLIAYYAGDLIWKERDARLNEISDASPVNNSVLFISKFLGVLLLLFFMQTLVMLTGFIVQFRMGTPSIDLLLYFQVLFGLRMVDLLFFAVIAFLVHILVNQKYVGHLILFMVFFYMYFPAQLNLEHKLLIYGAAPEWTYSEIGGFMSSFTPWLWFKLYWAAWAVVLALVSKLFWIRGREQKINRRFEQAKAGIPRNTAKIGFPVLLVILVLGAFIFYNTNVLNSYSSADDTTARSARYEKTYSRYKNSPQPILTDVQLQVELYPEEQTAEIKGIYSLLNKTSAPIDTLHISTTSEVNPEKISFSEEAELISLDNELGHRMYKLKNALKPGNSLSFIFSAKYEQSGFSNHGRDRDIVANGTYLGFHIMPAIGYQEHRELSDKTDRQKFALSPQPKVPSLYDRSRRIDISGSEKINFKAILGTSPEQTAITAGRLKRSWTEKGRQYFEYATDVPITHNYEIFSAKYALREASWKEVDIQIFYHPTHTRNLDRLVFGIQRSLEYFSKTFSPYPHSQIRLVEYPGGGFLLNGNPVTMSYTEGFSFLAPEKDLRELDFPFAVIAHEVAHQWWGNELRPAYVEGAPILTESLAWYSSWMLVEKTFGKEDLDLLLKVMRREYLTPRSPADLPLIRTTDKFSAYRKGPFALYTIQEYIGKEKVNLALKKLLEKFESREPPLPTTLDLYAELEQVTPDSLQYLLEDLFMRNTYWEFKPDNVVARENNNGQWTIDFTLTSEKDVVDEEGNVTALPMNDHVEIAVYANSPEGEAGELLYQKMHLLKRGEQRIQIQVNKQPELVGIDPNRLLIERDITNNFSGIEAARDPL